MKNAKKLKMQFIVGADGFISFHKKEKTESWTNIARML